MTNSESKKSHFKNISPVQGEKRKKVMKALQESEEKYRRFYEDAPLGYQSLDASGNFRDVNREWLNILGYSKEEVIGRFFADFISPESLETFEASFSCFKSSGKIRRTELEMLRKDGSCITVSINGNVEYDEEGHFRQTHCILHDITERRRVQEELKKSEERYRRIVEDQTEFIVRWKPDGVRTFVNDSYCRYFGKSRDELIGSSFFPLISEKDREKVRKRIESIGPENPVSSDEHQVIRPDGSIGWNLWTDRAIFDEEGRLTEFQSVGRDITERKKAEANLKRIEWLLTKSVKPESDQKKLNEMYMPPYGDLSEINTSRVLLDSVGKDTLLDVVNDYLDLLDTSTAVYEKNGDYALGIFSSGWCQFLDQVSRNLCDTDDNIEALNSGKWLCHESCWPKAAKVSIETGQPVDVECNGGLHLYAVPIFAGEEIVGSINFGYGDPPKEPEKLRMIAGKYNIDIEVLRKCADEYESRPPYIIDISKNRLKASARLIGGIVERKKAKKALQESEHSYRTLVEANPYGIQEIDTSGIITYTNPAYQKMLGYTEQELLGKSILDLLEPESRRDELRNYLSMLVKEQPPPITYYQKNRTKDDRVIDMAIDWNYKRDNEGYVVGFTSVITDITEQKKAEQKVLDDQAQLKSLASQLSLIEERERHRLATELHDQIGQSLVFSKIKLDQLREVALSGELTEVLEEVCDCLGQVIRDMRTLTFDLSYPILYELGFEAAVSEWLDEQIEGNHGIKTEFVDDGQVKPLDDDIRAILFRNVRELLVNVIKHAQANKVKISTCRLNEYIHIYIEDDGVGFDSVKVASTAAKETKFGLFSIRQRLEQLGGHLEIDSGKGRGSKITMTAPLKLTTSKK